MPAETNTVLAEVCDTIQPGQRWFWDKAPAYRPPALRRLCRQAPPVQRPPGQLSPERPPNTDGLIAGPQLERLRELGHLVSKP